VGDDRIIGLDSGYLAADLIIFTSRTNFFSGDDMNLGLRRTLLATTTLVFVCALSIRVTGQQPQAPQMAEDVFKNVTVLKGITVNEFMATMGVFSASLGMSCQDWHAADDSNWENFKVDNARKRMARQMITMMAEINKVQFGGRQMVTCYSCHRGADRPKTAVGILDTLYGPPPENPNYVLAQAPNAPTADSILDKYIQALGGAQKLAALTSYTATGKSVGYGPESAEDRPVDVYAKAPNQISTVVRAGNGLITRTIDGTNVWIAAPLRQPLPVMTLGGKELAAAKLEGVMAFPGQIKTALTKWRSGFPSTVNDKDVNVVQGETADGAVATFYFDAQTGLLERYLRYTASPVGPLVTQMDYSDYRDVAGVKMPYKYTLTWLDGREIVELTQIRPNVAVEASRFAKPAPPVAPARR